METRNPLLGTSSIKFYPEIVREKFRIQLRIEPSKDPFYIICNTVGTRVSTIVSRYLRKCVRSPRNTKYEFNLGW